VIPVSVIMPSRNQAHWIRRSLDAIVSDPVVAEIVVMDRCSADDTAVIVAGYPRTRFIQQETSYQERIALGFTLARHDWVCVLTTSDWNAPRALQTMMACVERDPLLAYVGAGTVIHEVDGRRRLKLPAPGYLTLDDVIADGQRPGIMVHRRGIIAEDLGYPTTLSEDSIFLNLHYLLHTLTRGWRARRLARPLIHFRRHAGSLSADMARNQRVYEENAAYRRRLAEEYAHALTPTQRRTLADSPTGQERLGPRIRRYLARRWYA